MTPDLVVVGGGVAGWSAATRALQLGGRVTVLEKAEQGPGLGNGIFSGGIIHAAYYSPKRPPDELFDRIMAKTAGAARADVARAWADNVGRAVTLLEAAGANFEARGPAEFQQHMVAPPTDEDEIPHGIRRAGPARLLTRMWRAFEAGGGTFRPGMRAEELVVADGRVTGVICRRPDGGREVVDGGAVLIADGGFQGDRELVTRHITTEYVLRGSPMDTGDGLRMGLAVGAATMHMDNFYGFVLVRDALHDPHFVRLGTDGPQPLHLINAAIVVDGHGRRIGNEDLGTEPWSLVDEPLAAAIARCDTPGDCWVVFDEAHWETAGRAQRPDKGDTPINPALLEAGGTFLSADSIPALAQAAGLPGEALTETVDGFNRYASDEAPIAPVRTGRPQPLIRPPFHAIPLIAGITYAMGGLTVNGHAQVLDERDRPIPGLYAAGGAMGGLQGGPPNGYSGGWSEASTFGLLAAEHALGDVRPPAAAHAAAGADD